jgi:uncharacterized protein (DUF488 family)
VTTTPTVLTIGHSTRALAEFLELLAEFGATTLVDVRRFPGSRRYPHFGGPALARSLAGAGVGYVPEPDLGGRRDPAPDSPNAAWRVAAFRGYADHMATPEFRAGLERVRARAAEGRPVIMCAEAVPWRCHRQLIADALVARGVAVRHILGPGQERAHELSPSARPGPDGVLVYPAPTTNADLFRSGRG